MPTPVLPTYDRAWIGAVVPALRAPVPPPWLPEPAALARRHVLMVLDGLGWDALRRHTGDLPVLAGMAGGPITAAAPTTTATCLTSITTGAVPADHGLVGYRIVIAGASLNVLRWQVDGKGSPPEAAQVQPLPPFGGHGLPVHTKIEFRESGFTGAHLRGGTFVGYATPAVLVEQVRRSLAADAPLTYVYYDGIDKVAHAHGITDELIRAELAATDRLVADLLGLLPADTALVVTADHGQVPVGPDDVVDLPDDLTRMVRTQAGESRFRSLYARRGAAADLAAAATDLYGDVAWVLTRDRLFDEGWLGPGGSAEVRQRVGDVLLVPHAPVAFADPSYPKERELRARHGSLTAAEVQVPLLAATR